MSSNVWYSPIGSRRGGLAVVALLAGLAAPWIAIAASDTVESLGFDPEQLRGSFFGALRGYYGAPDVPSAVRALPAEQKAAAVQVLGVFAKSYFASAGFKKGYRQAYKENRPRGSGLPSLNPKGPAEDSLEKARGKAADAYRLEKDPREQLERRLQAFLDATADVDYAATTHANGSIKVFDDAHYEAKPVEWKMCYRADRETGDAARDHSGASIAARRLAGGPDRGRAPAAG